MKSTFSGFIAEADDQVLVTEAFNSNPYDLTFGKKSAGDIFFTFHDEDDKEFRIQFYTPQGLGKNVRQVFIGTKKGASYLDSQQKFKNPMRVAATMIQATKDFLDTPIGKGIDGFAINFSKKVMDRGIALLPKIIRTSGLKQKLNVMDLKYSPDDSRGYVWVVRKGKDPAAVFDGPKMKGITWDDPDKVGDVPVQVDQVNPDWNISIAAKSGSIESTTVSVQGNDVTLSSRDVTIIVRDGAMAKIARDQSIAQVTIFEKQYVGRGEVELAEMRMSDRQGMGWYLKADGKRAAYVEFGVGAVAQPPTRRQFQHMTSTDMDNHPFRRDVLNNINDAVRKEGIAVPGSSKGYYKFNAGGSFRVYFDKVEGNSRDGLKFYGSVATDKGTIRFESAFDTAQVTTKFLEIIRNNAPAAKPSSGVQQYWKFSTSSDGKWPILSFDDGSNSYMVMGDPKTKNITATRARSITKGTGKTIEIALKKISGSNPPEDLKKQFMDMLNGGSQPGDELTTDRWRALSTALAKVKDFRGVSSSTTISGGVNVGNKGRVSVTMGRGIQRGDDPVTVVVKALDSDNQPMNHPIILRDIDITKPALLTKTVQQYVDDMVTFINKKIPDSAALDAKSVIQNLNAQRTSSNDIDWNITESNGKITVDWDLTFRRNSFTGAFQEYQTEISRANAALNRMETILQNAGYKTQNFIPTLYDMRVRDASGGGYSEYEQSIGGQVSGTK